MNLEKLKAEAKHKLRDKLLKTNGSYDIKEIESFELGWDACVKAMEPTVTMEARYIEFLQELTQICIFLGTAEEVAKEFANYWTEPNKSKTKMRFELQKTWDTKRRLQTWIKNDKKFNPKDTVGGEKKPQVMAGNYMDRFK